MVIVSFGGGGGGFGGGGGGGGFGANIEQPMPLDASATSIAIHSVLRTRGIERLSPTTTRLDLPRDPFFFTAVLRYPLQA